MKMSEYIRSCDDDFRARLYSVSDCISGSINNTKAIRLISLSGPTCSGKTTAAVMLAARLEERGRRVNIISIDDFYYDREYLHRLSKFKGLDGIDYDSVDTIDTAALTRFVDEALGETVVHCPIFNFKTGNREGYRELRAGKDDVFIFEGIQAIYPEITALFEPHGFVSVYIAPMSELRVGAKTFLPNEIRLMRRLVRDHNFRNTDAEFTMHLWESVRANEERSIFPYADTCVHRIDSTMKYEIGVLKPFLDELLPRIPEDSPYYANARYILEKISNVEAIDASLIEADSLYREFV